MDRIEHACRAWRISNDHSVGVLFVNIVAFEIGNLIASCVYSVSVELYAGLWARTRLLIPESLNHEVPWWACARPRVDRALVAVPLPHLDRRHARRWRRCCVRVVF